MRKAVAVGLGLLVIGSLYLRPLARHPGTLRIVAALLAAALLTAASFQSGPQPTVASKLAPVDPVAVARMATPIVTGYGSRQPVTIDFSRPMDAASVERALRVEPQAEVSLAWAPNGHSLTVSPTGTWQPAVFYTISVGAGARDQAGRELAEPVETGFFTRSQPSVTLATLDPLKRGRAGLQPSVQLVFDRPVDVASVRAALTISPDVAGGFVGLDEGDGVQEGVASDGFADRFIWRPAAALKVNTTYTVSLAASVKDDQGLTLRAASKLAFRTAAAPGVIRFRPFSESADVPVGALVSIRFSQAMDHKSTEAAFKMSQRGGGSVRGAFSWAEMDTVLVFDPRGDLVKGARYDVSLKGTARSATGIQLAKSIDIVSAWDFGTVPKPGQPAPTPTGDTGGGSSGGSGGGSGGGTGTSTAPWLGVEQYYLGLLNCSRTGGWVQTDGDCVGYGSGRYSRYVAPLSLSSAISSRVARPYAKFLATRGLCSHFSDGGPDDRLRRAGFTSYRWAENLGCRSGDPYAAVLGSHVYTFQAEANGPVGGTTGHWVNMKNPDYTTVGIGVWVSNGRVRLVINFYDP